MLLFTAVLLFATPNSAAVHTDDTERVGRVDGNDAKAPEERTVGWASSAGGAAGFFVAAPVAFVAAGVAADAAIGVMGIGMKLKLPAWVIVGSSLVAFAPAPLLFALPLVVGSMLGAGGAAWLAGDDVTAALVGGAVGGGVAAALDFTVLIAGATFGATMTLTRPHATAAEETFAVGLAVALLVGGPVVDGVATPLVAARVAATE